jgi:hypothetical protein
MNFFSDFKQILGQCYIHSFEYSFQPFEYFTLNSKILYIIQ